MTDNVQEIRITPETARKALYELDGPIASDGGMIIENALTLWEEEREQLDTAKQENERLTKILQTPAITEDDYGLLKNRLKQAIEALESYAKPYDTFCGNCDQAVTIDDGELARKTLALIREEANPHSAPASGSADSVGTEELKVIEVKSFTDRKGNKVYIGDTVGYFGADSQMKASGKIGRITKAGYFISVFLEGQKHPWYKSHIEKIRPKATDPTE